jgi:hypothetical protein
MNLPLLITLVATVCFIVVLAYVRSTTKISPRNTVDYLSVEEERKRLQDKRDAKSISSWHRFLSTVSELNNR